MTFHSSIGSVARPVCRLIMGTGFWRRLEQREANVVRVYYSVRNFERLRRARQLAEELGATPTQLALAWVLHQGDHVSAVGGPCAAREAKEMFEAFEIRLDPDTVRWLKLES